MATIQKTSAPRDGLSGAARPRVSVVIPCLDEADSIEQSVTSIVSALGNAALAGEVLVVDNGSEDGSAELAERAGARVIREPRRGYGSAYLAGFGEARGEYIVMLDADLTYPAEDIPRFVEKLDEGAELVMGDRMDNIQPGAMPWLHRYVGNPILSGILNLFFRTGVRDAHCGMRAFRRDVLPKLDLRTTGMEFASEMVIKAAKNGLRIEEVPITYRPRVGDSKLNSVRDAWRHVRFMLVHSATFLFLIPGGIAMAVGFALLLTLAADRTLGDPSWTVPAAIAASFLVIVASQVVQLGLYARTYAAIYLGDDEPLLQRLWRRFRLEHGLAVSGVVLLVGVVLTAVAHFNDVSDPALGLLGLTLVALAVQGVFSAFFLSILGLSEHAILRRQSREAPEERRATARV
jgi:Glycosyl transferase family 2